jgi:hypothetical protein
MKAAGIDLNNICITCHGIISEKTNKVEIELYTKYGGK